MVRAATTLVLLLAAPLARGAIYRYDDVSLPPQELMFRRAGMYAPQDAVSHSPPGYGRSFIKVDLHFTRYRPRVAPSLASSRAFTDFDPKLATEMEVLVFDSRHFNRIGWVPKSATAGGAHPDAPKTYCCNDAAIRARVCTRKNTIIVQPAPGGGGSAPISGVKVKDITSIRVPLPPLRRNRATAVSSVSRYRLPRAGASRSTVAARVPVATILCWLSCVFPLRNGH